MFPFIDSGKAPKKYKEKCLLVTVAELIKWGGLEMYTTDYENIEHWPMIVEAMCSAVIPCCKLYFTTD